MRKSFLARVALEEEEVAVDPAVPTEGVVKPDEKASSSALVNTPPAEGEYKPAEGGVLASDVDAMLAETDETEASVNELTADIEEGTEVIEAMESMAVIMRESLKTGGMTAQEAKLVNITTDYMHKVVGIKNTQLPALESYTGKDRVSSTTLALETIAETVKKIWEAIKKAVAKVVEYFKEFFFGLNTAATKLKDKAIKLFAAPGVKDMDFSKVVVKYDEHSVLLDKILNNDSNLAGSLLLFDFYNDNFFEAFIPNVLVKGAKDIEQAYKTGNFETHINNILSIGNPIEKFVEKTDGYAVYDAVLPGNKIIVNEYLKRGNANAGSILKAFKLYVEDNPKPAKDRSGATIEIPKEIGKLIYTSAVEVTDYIIKNTGKNSRVAITLENIRIDFEKTINAYLASPQKPGEEFTKEEIDDRTGLYNAFTTALQAPVTNYSKYALSTANSYLSFMAILIKEAGKESK